MSLSNNQQLQKTQRYYFSKNYLEVFWFLANFLGKIAIIFLSIIQGNQALLLLIFLLFVTETLNLLILFIGKNYPKLNQYTPIFYAINFVFTLSAVAYFSGWIINEFFLFYILYIAFITFAFGLVPGLVGLILTILIYGSLLFLTDLAAYYYLRILAIVIISVPILINEKKSEKASSHLNYVIDVEKAKGDFIAIASHNLRTPVAAIYGYIELLQRSDLGPLNEKQLDALVKIKKNNQELEKLTERLLQISIIEIGDEIELIRHASQVEVIIQDVVDNMGPMAREKKLKLNYQPATHLPLVNIDAEKIRAVLTNLVDNSIKYTDEGTINIQAGQSGNFVTVSVADTGIGIPREELPKIFNKFYRAGNILVYNKTGTGLGLYLGRRIVELHGGKMSVRSEEGKGSIFTIYLPIAKEEVF